MSGIKAGNVQITQVGASIKHSLIIIAAIGVTEVCYLGSVEIAQIQRFKFNASMEHAAHINNIGGIEIGNVNRFQVGHVAKHATHNSDT